MSRDEQRRDYTLLIYPENLSKILALKAEN
jgi:hypothetical protein